MHNLRNIRHTVIDFENLDDSLPANIPLTASAWDGDSVICTFGPCENNTEIELKRITNDGNSSINAVVIASWEAPSPNPDLPYDKVLNLHCFPDNGTICIVMEGGDIVVVHEDVNRMEENQIEIVGSVDTGIAAAGWSPDEETLIIASKSNTLLFMTREFEGTATIDLTPEDLKISNHVSVGWGKRETQFQGRGAKALRDPTVPEHVDEGTLSADDDLRTAISWRGDGQFVAINSILNAEPKRRVIRVYSRDGSLESVSEPVDGLRAALSWKPSGQLIAGIRGENHAAAEVVFFERNGLRHGEFPLQFPREFEEQQNSLGAIELDWNVDSSVLAVSLVGRVQLWTMGNYHYYLKQEIEVGDGNDRTPRTVWHPERPFQLTLASTRTLHMLKYTAVVARGCVVPPHDYGLVVVADGRNLKITPMRIANVPPPMAFDEIKIREPAIDIAVNKQGTRIAVLTKHFVSLYRCDYSRRPAIQAELMTHLQVTMDLQRTIPQQIAVLDGEKVAIACGNKNGNSSRLFYLDADPSTAMAIEEGSINLFPCTFYDKIMYQNQLGAVGELSGTASGRHVGSIPAACQSVEVWRQHGVQILFGLTAGGMLYVQGESQSLKVSSCTSFIVTGTHLVYTTSQHLLKFVHLHAGELEIPPDEPEKDERCRNIERGAKLITVMPSTYCLVLQMPRGNLETIYPRALVLAGIRSAIGQKKYKKAFQICRTHRADMNILYDYAPKQFMGDVDLFVEQVKSVEHIDLFLSSLSEEDVSQTIYKETNKARTQGEVDGIVNGDALPHSTDSASKVNRICDAFLKALSGLESTHLQNIVSAYVCRKPPDLEAGLALVAELRKQGKQEHLEQAVEHICFLADVNQLYDTALGIYDLDVALLVAQQSQKDPREYLPYLQNLHDMDAIRRRHEIDNDLKRYKKALTHLHAAGEFEQLKSYATKHDLYSTAIELYRYDSIRLGELMKLYADFLSSRNRYKDAGMAYEYTSDYTLAYEAYRSCGMWRECLACAALMNVSEEKIADLARDLAGSLEEGKNFVDAATVHLEHLDDLEAAVRLLCRSYHFADAIRQVAMRKRPELLKGLVDPGLIEASAAMTEMLAEMRTQLQNQVPRLRELRQKKAEDPLAFLDSGVGADHDDLPDDISLAPTDANTAGTFMTRYTNRSTGTLATNATRKTSKNRRREERKRARGKKGTVYEEEYLVNSIARLIERVNSTGDDTSRLVEGLMRRAMRERAVAVESSFQEVVDACGASAEEVFSAPVTAPSAGAEDPARPWGGQGVLWEAMSASQQKKEAPTLKTFEKLTLLER